MAFGAPRQKELHNFSSSYLYSDSPKMDVLHCETYEVNGRVYRRNAPLNVNITSNLKGGFDLPDQAEEDEYDSDLDYGEELSTHL